MSKYSIGVDFGSESGRAVLVDVSDGREVAESVLLYPHGVIDRTLPSTGVSLPPDWALQDPSDYIEVFRSTIPEVLRTSGVSPDDVIGLGIDFTACTMLPTRRDGTPLCLLPDWRAEPHAWVKLWKHHAAQPEANELNRIAAEGGFSFLARYGGKISSEWMIPKIWQILDEAPAVYEAADRFLEAADWVVWRLTGSETRNSCTAGYKAIWSKREGYPPREFFRSLDPRMEDLVDRKLSRKISNIGDRAGGLTAEAAAWTGLLPGTAVAVANVDAHVTVPAVGVTRPGTMVAIMGTSTCHMVLGEGEKPVPGICGYVEDGIIPGYTGYEAGQSCVGDHFAWFARTCVPAAYEREAESRGVSTLELLEEKAARLRPGESGLVALDWWNGNRTVLVDVDLTGLLVGMTLATKPEETYRALMEATAFGTRVIVETLRAHGVAVDRFVAAGGLPNRSPLLMSIYADVLDMEIRLPAARQAPALGSAMFGAVAAGVSAGGYDTIFSAAERMARLRDEVYRPDPDRSKVYDALYTEYLRLHDHFGRGGDDIMKRLKALRLRIRGNA